MDQKLCNSCKQYKDITEFSYRNITTQDTTKKDYYQYVKHVMRQRQKSIITKPNQNI